LSASEDELGESAAEERVHHLDLSARTCNRDENIYVPGI